jgi:prepilin-type N-terminal cleavage/methylation domain-containing protein
MPKFFFQFKRSKGFTLLEVLVAVFILVVGAGAAFSSISQTLGAASLVKDRFIASYLGQEGIEIVKNIRDSNWVAGGSWNRGLAPGDYGLDYKNQSAPPTTYLNRDADSSYSYSFGTQTKFRRRINIQQIDPDRLRIEVVVEWQERGRSHDFRVVDIITNWLTP